MTTDSDEHSRVSLKIEYISKNKMEKVDLNAQLDFSVVSLYGKVGTSQIPFKMTKLETDANVLTVVTERDCAERFWQALMLTSVTLNGAGVPIRFKLLDATEVE